MRTFKELVSLKLSGSLLVKSRQAQFKRSYTNTEILNSVGTLAPDGFYCGHSFAQHHPNGSVAFLHGGLLKTIPKAVMQWQRERGGIFQVYKRSIVDERHNLIERVAIKMDGASYLPDRPEDTKTGMCTDIWDVHPRKLDEIIPGFQKTFEEIGGYWMLDDDETYNS